MSEPIIRGTWRELRIKAVTNGVIVAVYDISRDSHECAVFVKAEELGEYMARWMSIAVGGVES